MKRVCIALGIALAALTAHAEGPLGRQLTQAKLNALYCQLTGCTMTGTFNATSITATGTIAVADGSVSAPSIARSADSTHGFFFGLTGQVCFGIGGAIGSSVCFDVSGMAAGRTVTLNIPSTSATYEVARITSGKTFVVTNTLSLAGTDGTSQNFGTVANSLSGVWLPQGNIYTVTSDFTLAANTNLQTITGLSWILPANVAAKYPFRCDLTYSQATAAVADQFGIQAASLAPTNINAQGWVGTSVSAITLANLPTLTTTTATAIVTFTPSAITTIWNARLAGLIDNPSGVANTINIMAQTSNSADLVTVKKGSYCVVGF